MARPGRLLGLLLLLLALVLPWTAHATNDPSRRWYAIETAHFRITYHSGLETVAQHVANIAEGIYDTMRGSVGWTPSEPTEIFLEDYTESANGSAAALPYNALRLIVTAPEDMSPLGDVDDWFYELITHEYTHILHTDHIRGIPALVNAVLGKTLAPNQTQPRWILEGLAVFEESARTSGGRLRNSQWDMWMRADVLGDNIATIDQLSNSVRRWPQGNLYYLYGSYFMKWIAETYGEDALRKMADDYGKQLIPWGFNRSIRRATGKTFIEMYDPWVASMKVRYQAQAAAVRAQGIREGARITHAGQNARYPRWIPANAWPEQAGGLLYYRDDQNERAGLYALPLQRDARGAVTNARAAEKKIELEARVAVGESVASFAPDGALVFGATEVTNTVLLYDDLERVDPRERSTFGLTDRARTRLTSGVRASDPTVSPDGRRVVYTVNDASTRSIHIADLGSTGLTNARPLVPTPTFEQSFTPRWSPDGTHIAYSVWKTGGYRDIRYVDVASGAYRDLTFDRAVDGAPSFSADGRFLFFHSDRTGIPNIYAYELTSGRVRQVTNVLTGAYMPEPSPDGKTLAYVGYTTAGFDLYAMPLDESAWTEAPTYDDERPNPRRIANRVYPVKDYSPWRTLVPRKYSISYTDGSFGKVIIINAAQQDISGIHSVALSSVTEIEKPQLQGSLAYTYGRLPFDMGLGISRTLTPRLGYGIGSYKPVITQETNSVASSIGYTDPTPYDTTSYVINYTVSRTGAQIPTAPTLNLDPYATTNVPARGLAASIHLAYAYSNAERYLYGVGAERGFSLSMAFDLTDPALGSDFAGFVTNGDLSVYTLMPWLKHHSVALHAGAGTSGGVFPGRGAFYVGSFVELPVVDTIRNQLIQGGITLRGYPPVIEAGRSYTLGNVEYRFPIVNVDRGPSTLPLFLNRINGNVFFDYGSAFDEFRDAQFKSGVGGELWFDMVLGYVASFTFRIGYAKGLAFGGLDKTYFVAAVPY